MKKRVIPVFLLAAFLLMSIVPMVSAGLGIKWTQESMLVPEKTKTCITYFVYNPWEGVDTNAEIFPSEEFEPYISSSKSEIKFVPGGTSSSEAIPIEFCFKSPKVYERDCWIGDSLICKQECAEEMFVVEGEMIAKEVVADSNLMGVAQGSATSTSIAAPMRLRVSCVPHNRNYSLIYILVALIAGVLLVISLLKDKKKEKPFSKKKKDSSEEKK